MSLELRLSMLGFSCWLDQKARTITKESMLVGIQSSKVFLLFLSKGVLTRPFCLYEIESAFKLKKVFMLVHETEERHGAFDFGEAATTTTPQIADLLESHESLPWRRRGFEQVSPHPHPHARASTSSPAQHQDFGSARCGML